MKKRMRKKFFRLPLPGIKYRILLYLCMILFSVLSVVSAVTEKTTSVISAVCYAIAALLLLAGGYYLVLDIRYGVKEIKLRLSSNVYTKKIAADYRLRTVLGSVPGLAGNLLFAVFNGAVGIISSSAWFGSLAAYYILLSMMRIEAVRQEKKISRIQKKEMRLTKEIAVYRKNSLLFLLMAVVLAGMVILLEASLGGKSYPGMAIYAAAFYTFYRIILSVVHLVKANREKSPLLMILRKIGYIDACVSMFTLQTAMFASFSNGQKGLESWMNGITGSAVCLMVFGIGLQGVMVSAKLRRKYHRRIWDDSCTCGRG